ncbi:MAG: carboxylesterase family protein [Saprospiraceae bacterium]|nr:carboxylesterase family protein [Saprospiraceae bacterium]
MKKFTLLLFSLFAIHAGTAYAQNAGCDGSRYLDDIFSTVKKTTVNYAPTIGHVNNSFTLQMDVYEPEGDNLAARPAVVLAHGGSFVFGDKSMMQPYCELLARKGYVAVSIQYRLYPFLLLGFPDSLDIFDTAVKAVGDMRAAVRFLREDAATNNLFHIDADHVFIGGYSAGAVTALHSGFLDSTDVVPEFLQTLVENNGGLEGISGTASNHTYSSSAKAVVNMSGGLYRKEWVGLNNLPLVSIHGTQDETVNYVYGLAAGIAFLEGSSLLHQQAEAIGLWNFLETVPGGGHTNTYSDPQFEPYVDTFWVHATGLLESLTCATTDAHEATLTPVQWSVAPNPNSGDVFTVTLPETVSTANLMIRDVSGKTVLQVKNIQNQSLVPISQLTAGAYFVQVQMPGRPDLYFPVQRLVKR